MICKSITFCVSEKRDFLTCIKLLHLNKIRLTLIKEELKLNFKKTTISTAALITLTACGAGNNHEVGQNQPDNLQPVRNDSRIEAPMQGGYNRANQNNRTTYDGTYQRDQDLTADNNRMNNDQYGGATNNIGRGRYSHMNNRQQDEQYKVSKKAAKRITSKMDNIDNAYVLTMGNNAYVAAKVKDNKGKMSDKIKEDIAKLVKSEEYNIDYVYVSTNPDFVNLTTDYADDMANGDPVEGFFDQMGNMIQRIFPQAQQ